MERQGLSYSGRTLVCHSCLLLPPVLLNRDITGSLNSSCASLNIIAAWTLTLKPTVILGRSSYCVHIGSAEPNQAPPGHVAPCPHSSPAGKPWTGFQSLLGHSLLPSILERSLMCVSIQDPSSTHRCWTRISMSVQPWQSVALGTPTW